MIDYLTMDLGTRAIRDERIRQERLRTEGRFKYTPASYDCPEWARFLMVAEELGEIARNLQARLIAGHNDGESDTCALMTELTQLSALSLAWWEALQRHLVNWGWTR
jgi:hypothetical protein